jgi:hypothetical protein
MTHAHTHQGFSKQGEVRENTDMQGGMVVVQGEAFIGKEGRRR